MPKVTQLVKVSARAIHSCQVQGSDRNRSAWVLVEVRLPEAAEQILMFDP